MDFPDDIDPSHFLDNLNYWDTQGNAEDDRDHQRRESLDKTSEFSCDLDIKQGSDDGRCKYPWEVLGFDAGTRDDDKASIKASNETEDQKVSSGGDNVHGQHHQQPTSSDAQHSPTVGSYESMMNSNTQSHHAQPQLVTHPLAMTSLSSCPSFPLSSSSNVCDISPSNGNTAANTIGSSSIVKQETPSIPQSSIVSGTSSSNANSSQTGNSQTSGCSISKNNLISTHQRLLLPSWNDSMGDLMYSSLLPTATASISSDGTSANPFQCTPLNSAFGTNFQQINHYGMAINGFHPQVNAIVNPVLPLNSTAPPPARAGTTSPGTVKTSNAGKSTTTGNTPLTAYSQQKPPTWSLDVKQQKPKDKKATSERNEREQMRAKKITQLIYEIRSNMEAEGWKEEMKSKYETLSQCKAYIEYLKRFHKEKEIDIEHTKKLIEEKALLEARSDPESIHDSVTSSLTASSRRSTSPEENGSDKESSSSSDNDQGLGSRKKRKTITYAEGIKAPNLGGSNKKSRSRHKRKEPSSSESSSEEDGNEGEGPGGKNISFDKTSSSVSDMTDSNRSSMNGASVNKKKQSQQHDQVNNEIGTASTATSSISSTAAVMRGSSHKSPQSHRHQRSTTLDAVADAHGESQNKPHKKKRRSFDYNFKEVFLKSNVPQLIVTLSGRVVVWNDFFLLTTGMTKREAKNTSIFSIVESNQLTELYKFVARALADSKLPVPSPAATAVASANTIPSQTEMVTGPTQTSPSTNVESSDSSWEAITLKCIRFASKKNKDETTHPNPLYITVALMPDKERHKRCFHCIITDCPGTNGACASVTPELLSLLFSPYGKNNSKEGIDKSTKSR